MRRCEENRQVARVSPDSDGGYRLDTTSGAIKTRAVVAATGAYQRRNRPANNLRPSIIELNTDDYRNPGELPAGGVLVVGSAQSGCQVAENLRDSGRETWLATGTAGWIPRRYRGNDKITWRGEMGVFDETVDEVGAEQRLTARPSGPAWTESQTSTSPPCEREART